jgi:DNA-binding beta-propeller fold protein YncE
MPLFAQSRQPLVVAACKFGHMVALVNPANLDVVARIPTGEGPHEVCTAGAFAYAGIYGVLGKPGSDLAIFDPAAGKEVKRVSIQPLRWPHGLIAINGKIYFSAEQARSVGRFDIASGKLDWVMGTGQLGPHMIVATPDGRKLYTANTFDNTVSAIQVEEIRRPDGSRPTPLPGAPGLTQIKVGVQPEGIAISPDGREVWAGHNQDGGVSIIDTFTETVKHTIPSVSKMAFRLAFTSDGKTCVVAGCTGGEVVLIDAISRQVRARIATPDALPQGILISPDDQWLFVSIGPALLRIDLAKQTIAGQCAPGAGVDGLAWFAG